MGKGDAYRPVDSEKWRENYDRIFDKTKENNDEDQTETDDRVSHSGCGGRD